MLVLEQWRSDWQSNMGKQKFFAMLGCITTIQARLQSDVREAMKTARVRVSEPNTHGTVHIQANIAIGLNEKKTVVCGWILRKGSKNPELSTMRPHKGTKDDF